MELDKSDFMSLVTELQSEAWHVGFHEALYNNGLPHQHEEDKRVEIIRRKKIVESILGDIKKAVSQKAGVSGG